MIKMLFFKSKPKEEELLPPPPPFQTLELEEEKPKVEGLKPKKPITKKEKKIKKFHIEEIRKELKQETKPKEILEAEEEIKSAIENIKKTEEVPKEENLVSELPEADDTSIIQNKINETRQALMKLDLGTARKNYVEVMKIYNKIKPEEQAKVYHDIRDLYLERKSAEELKV